jgi:hypothetical protein
VIVEETMCNYRINNILRKGKVGLLILLVLLFWVINPMKTWAEDEKNRKVNEALVASPQSEDTDTPRSFDRFQIELYGGIIFLNPSDLNLFVSHDNRMQEFSYDSYLDYLVATDQIESWTKNQGEERKEIRRSYPIGGRLKYFLSETITLSLGLKYMSSTHTLDLDYQYFRNELSDERYNEGIRYSPYSLSAKAYIPTLGFHISKRMNNALVLEGFVTGGPMFANCRYFSDWSYEWVTEGPDYRYIVYSSTGVLEEEGSGTGIALDLGGRLSYPVIKSFEIFLEASYAYQVVKSISGSGREERTGRSATWDGRWGIKSETVAAAWGELETEFPTSYWPDNSEEAKVRDFELDLSGFQLKLGLSFRF